MPSIRQRSQSPECHLILPITILVTAFASAWPRVARMTRDNRAHRLHIAALELLDDVRVGRECLVDGLFERAVVGNDLEAVLLDDLVRSAFAGEHACDGLLGELVVELAVGDELLDLGDVGGVIGSSSRLTPLLLASRDSSPSHHFLRPRRKRRP